MNTIREIQKLNQRELENATPPEGSWHADYRDTAYVYVGGLSFDLTEGDIIAIFSQYGEPVWIKLVRDKDSGKSKGFAFIKYEDQRSTDLAVDNLGGAVVMGRTLKVDHTRYKRRDDDDMDYNTRSRDQDDDDDHRSKRRRTEEPEEVTAKRPVLPEELELVRLLDEHDPEDPMKEYLVEQKREEVDKARRKWDKENRKSRSEKSRHRHRSKERDDDHRSRRRSKERSHKKRSRTPEEKGSHRHRDRSSDRHRRRDRSSERDRKRDRS